TCRPTPQPHSKEPSPPDGSPNTTQNTTSANSKRNGKNSATLWIIAITLFGKTRSPKSVEGVAPSQAAITPLSLIRGGKGGLILSPQLNYPRLAKRVA